MFFEQRQEGANNNVSETFRSKKGDDREILAVNWTPGRCSCPNGRNQLFGALLVIWGGFSYSGGAFSYFWAVLVIWAKSVI